MKNKLLQLFYSKEKRFLFLFLVLFAMAGIYTVYILLNVLSVHYRWKPVKELDKSWHYYSDGMFDPDILEIYLLEHEGGMYVIDLRKTNCSYIDPDDIGWDDEYATGVIFSASDDTLEELQKVLPKAKEIIPVSDIVKKECDFFRVPGVMPLVILLFIWTLAVGSGVFWFLFALGKSKEEQQYLAYIGNPPKKLKRWFCSCFLRFIPGAWLVSFCAYFLPEPGFFDRSAFWMIYPEIPVVTLLVSGGMAFLLYLLNGNMWARRNMADKVYGTGETMRIFIAELSLFDNLRLILLAQGFKEEAAENLVMQMLEEKGIRFLANRRMSSVVKERIVFYELQDRLLGKIDFDREGDADGTEAG